MSSSLLFSSWPFAAILWEPSLIWEPSCYPGQQHLFIPSTLSPLSPLLSHLLLSWTGHRNLVPYPHGPFLNFLSSMLTAVRCLGMDASFLNRPRMLCGAEPTPGLCIELRTVFQRSLCLLHYCCDFQATKIICKPWKVKICLPEAMFHASYNQIGAT